MKCIEAPNYYGLGLVDKSLFLAGGITNCPDWQKELVGMLENTHLAVFNPRRKNFPIEDPSAAREQIEWEHRYLQQVSAISFWFCNETVQPIVLLEFGRYSVGTKPIFVGVDPLYKRKQDIEIQLELVRPKAKIVSSLTKLGGQIREWAHR